MKLFGMKFALRPASKLRKNEIGHTRITNTLVEGTTFVENGVIKIHVEMNDPGHSQLVLDFTPDSYNLYNREVVFDKVPDAKYGRGMYIRKEREYKYSPGNPNRYTTICEKCIYNGYIVRDNKTKRLMFQMNRFIRRHGHIWNDE